jgi:3-hydroxyacyl-CoA dehydrogenase
MNYEERLQNVSVLGAAGKMGSGILLLTAVEIAGLKLLPGNKDKTYVINAIDVSSEALSDLHNYLETQIKKIAEKKIIQLRRIYANNSLLIENSDIIEEYIGDVMKIVRFTTRVEASYNSGLIFEAIIEDVNIKIKLISQIRENSAITPWFFTNTSSVPISELDSGGGLNGNIIGFHFYNPPAVQKLVELIATEKTVKELVVFSETWAKRLNKKLIRSHDFAGFIGNGHFMRDLLYGIQVAELLSREMSFVESVYAVNRITQDFLIRPMGIFQLMDYVGVDVCQNILRVMSTRLNDDSLQSSLIDKLITLGIKGGQNSDGSQKPGILSYVKGRPASIYDPDKKEYLPVESFKTKVDSKLGKLPDSFKPWKDVISDKDKDKFLKKYFNEIRGINSFGAKLTVEYLINSKKVGIGLVKNGVADNEEDVNEVLLTGFFHAYGPVNSFVD